MDTVPSDAKVNDNTHWDRSAIKWLLDGNRWQYFRSPCAFSQYCCFMLLHASFSSSELFSAALQDWLFSSLMDPSVERKVEYQNTTPEAMHAEAWNLIWSMETPSRAYEFWSTVYLILCLFIGEFQWNSRKLLLGLEVETSQECSCIFRYHGVFQLMHSDTASNFPQNGSGNRTSMWSHTFLASLWDFMRFAWMYINEQNPKKRHQLEQIAYLCWKKRCLHGAFFYLTCCEQWPSTQFDSGIDQQ